MASAPDGSSLVDTITRIGGHISTGDKLVQTGISAMSLFDGLKTLIDKAMKGERRLSEVIAHWRTGQPSGDATPRVKAEGLARMVELSSSVAHNTGSTDPSKLIDTLQAVPAVVQSSMLVNALFTLLDGYLTRRVIRREAEELEQTLRQGFSEVVDNLQRGFERLDARFAWGFSELAWRVEQQTDAIKRVEEILLNPLDVQARELRKRGIMAYNYGWFDVALKDLKEAMEKSRVDYVIAHYLGNIYLFHENDFDNAVSHYSDAVRFSKPFSTTHHAIALASLGLAYYLSDRGDRMDNLRAAADSLSSAVATIPGNLELRFQKSQYCVLVGRVDEAIEELDYLIRADIRFVLRILTEGDFIAVREQVNSLLVRYATELATEAKRLLAERMVDADRFRKSVYTPIGRHSYGPPTSDRYVGVVKGHPLGKVKDPEDIGNFPTALYVHDYSEDRQVRKYFEILDGAAEVYATGELFSLYACVQMLRRLPKPEKREQTIVYRVGLKYSCVTTEDKTTKY
ncbi:MAG: tetratricopeptide repeat protein, partial [Pseudomonadota bacterium]|nr:tetratricopeptide repeat protein [Pseudomonadota bacterium]